MAALGRTPPVILWTAATVFPLTTYHLGFYGGAVASMAGICAVIETYHSEEVVCTRGGKVYKKDSGIGYRIPHLFVGFLVAGMMVVCILNAVFGAE
jgi:5,10-methenyltetrahydromethanopterin hydrogenase